MLHIGVYAYLVHLGLRSILVDTTSLLFDKAKMDEDGVQLNRYKEFTSLALSTQILAVALIQV